MWKIRKKAKNCNFRKGIKLQRESAAPGTGGFTAGLHRYMQQEGHSSVNWQDLILRQPPGHAEHLIRPEQ